MLGGVCGQQFKTEILPKLVNEPKIIDKYTSLFAMLNQEPDGGIQVSVSPKFETLKNAACEHIASRASKRPVIVIGGMSFTPALKALLPKGIEVHRVKTDNDVDQVKSIQENFSKGVILLDDKLGYGTDLRPKEQPECVIIAKEMPNHYDCM